MALQNQEKLTIFKRLLTTSSEMGETSYTSRNLVKMIGYSAGSIFFPTKDIYVFI
jgi:hypothetical protein